MGRHLKNVFRALRENDRSKRKSFELQSRLNPPIWRKARGTILARRKHRAGKVSRRDVVPFVGNLRLGGGGGHSRAALVFGVSALCDGFILSYRRLTLDVGIGSPVCGGFVLPLKSYAIGVGFSCHPGNQSVNHSANQSTNQSISQSVNQKGRQPISQLISRSVKPPINHSVSQSIGQ